MVTVPDFFEVVDEVTLGTVFGFFTDDLDRVLVRAHGAVSAQTPEYAAHGLGGFDIEGGSKSRLVWVTSSMMPIVKWFFGVAFFSSSKTALTMAGVNSLEDSP